MRISGSISRGHGVASGKAGDQRYPEGTLQKQLPYFKEKGLDLSAYFLGTINLDIAPYQFEIRQPKFYFQQIDWSHHIPPENFYFFDVKLHMENESYDGLIYMPDPETKVEHRQKATILELILPKIEGLRYQDQVEIEVSEDQLLLFEDTD